MAHLLGVLIDARERTKDDRRDSGRFTGLSSRKTAERNRGMKVRTIWYLVGLSALLCVSVPFARGELSSFEEYLTNLPPSITSVAVEASDIDELAYGEEAYEFDLETHGRALENVDWTLVERMFGSCLVAPGEELTYADMLDLEGEGVLGDSSLVIIHFKWAVVRGDSSDVADELAVGQIEWHVSPPEEPAPLVPIRPALPEQY